MGLMRAGRVLIATLAVLPFANADVQQVGKLEERVAARLEFSSPSSSDGAAKVHIESGDTISHVLYAIKLKIGSRIPLYGRKSLVERYAKLREASASGQTNCTAGCQTMIVAGQAIEVPLEIFDVSKIEITENVAEDTRRPAQAETVETKPTPVPVAAPAAAPTAAPTQVVETPAEKFPRWAIGVGLGFRSLDGEERTNHTHANLVSKITQQLRLSRYFRIGKDFEVGAHYRFSRVEFDSEALNLELRQNNKFLSAFEMSFEKKWNRSKLALSLGGEETLFYYSRTVSDITIDPRVLMTGQLRFGNEIYRSDYGSMWFEVFGKSYSSSSGVHYSTDPGFGYGAAVQVQELGDTSRCGVEYTFRDQSTTYLKINEATLGLDCELRF